LIIQSGGEVAEPRDPWLLGCLDARSRAGPPPQHASDGCGAPNAGRHARPRGSELTGAHRHPWASNR